ncbi:MAG TPA: hybrid sensor histidine kinase/response regulator [Anaerolineae bacterium]|nr:hybrid sensor histidine kinase/response regulator [Anaerolineae bacterium]
MITANITPSDKTILVVDDNPTNLSVITDFLEMQDFNISVALDGESGIETATHTSPDLILLDVMMPGIDGFETCRRLKEMPGLAEIPVIFMTALASTEDKVKGFEVGAVDYVTKPIQQEEVLARIYLHLKLQTLQNGLQEANEQLTAQNEELHLLNASKDKFFSILSHDLRTPFNTLMGMSQLLAMELAGEEDREKLELAEHIFKAAETTHDLLNNLLTWSRMQTGHINYEPEQYLLGTAIQKTVDLLAETAKSKNIELVVVGEAGLMGYVDPNMIDTVVRNLTSNALKFTPEGGRITITERRGTRAGYGQVTVADTGVGIGEEDLGQLFRIDAHHSTVGTNQEAGSGLGLILCQDMVLQNKGEIWIESEVGVGTQVSFTVPLV